MVRTNLYFESSSPLSPTKINIDSFFGDMCVFVWISQVFWGDKNLGYVRDIWIHNGSYHRWAGNETFTKACFISKKLFPATA
jgi:hypothetical protein